MTDSLTNRLALWLIEQEPGLLAADPRACGTVCGALAANLGCNLATVIMQQGAGGYVRAVGKMNDIIHDNAVKTVTHAAHLAEHGGAGVSSANH
jgi:hypothetical protein